MRLGIALRQSVWAWALVEPGRGAPRIRRAGEVPAADLATIRAAIEGQRVRISIALPDRDCHLRRIRVGHPPESREALRRLVRWRLREELPSGEIALDARVDGEHAVVLAASAAKIAGAESALTALGPVDLVTAISLAGLAALPFGPSATKVRLIDDGGYFEAEVDPGRASLLALAARDGAPGTADAAVVDVDSRAGARLSIPLDEATWAPVDVALRGRVLPAVGAAMASERMLNVASQPPPSSKARRLASASLSAAAAFCALSVGLAWFTHDGVERSRRALAELPPAAPSATVAAPDPVVDALAGAQSPGFTGSLAQLERALPAAATLERIEWRGGVLTIRVAVRDASALDSTERALASSWTPITQAFRADGIVAEFKRSGT